MKYSLMSLMVDEELRHTKRNFILNHMLNGCGITDIPEDIDAVYELLNEHGIPVKNGTASFEDLVRFTKEHGFDGLDMMYYQMELSGKEMKAILDKYGVVLSAVNIIIPFAEADTEEMFEMMLQDTKNAIDHACEAGCKSILFVPGGYVLKDGMTREQSFQCIVRGLKAAISYAEMKGVKLSTETVESTAIPYCSYAEINRVFGSVPGLFYTHDAGNPMIANEDPITVYESLKDKVISVHFKELGYTVEGMNTYRCMDGKCMQCVPFGEGMVDFKEHLRRLQRDQYDGYITLEGGIPAENKWQEAIGALRYFREMEKNL